jgi:flagellar protein FlbD
MIKVNRLNGTELWVNAEMIEFIEATPDTVISLISHSKILVVQRPQDVVDAVVAYRRKILHEAPIVIEGEK